MLLLLVEFALSAWCGQSIASGLRQPGEGRLVLFVLSVSAFDAVVLWLAGAYCLSVIFGGWSAGLMVGRTLRK